MMTTEEWNDKPTGGDLIPKADAELAERGLRVKPLEWRRTRIGNHIAHVAGDYMVQLVAISVMNTEMEVALLPGAAYFALSGIGDKPVLYVTLESAKAAAEADLASRIAAQVDVLQQDET